MTGDTELLEKAWEARHHACPTGAVKVGCAIAIEGGETVCGWNVGGPWGKGIHAEVAAITQLVKTKRAGVKVAVVANAARFTPCGDCRDWLMKYCVPESPVLIGNEAGETHRYILDELCPAYPEE